MKKLATFFVIYMWCVSSHAERVTQLECPATVKIENVAIDQVSQDKLGRLGWKSGFAQLQEAQLSGFSLMLGHSEPYADQQADKLNISKSGQYFASYRLGGAEDVSIRCDYQLGLVRLINHLDGKFKRCEVSAQMKGTRFDPSTPNFIQNHLWKCFK